jgi:hypothetical protein
LATLTNVGSAGQYDVIAGGAFHSTNNPALEFETTSGVVRTSGGQADTLVMNSKTYRILIQNTWMRVGGSSVVSAVGPITQTSSRVTTHPLLPGYTIYIDELVPNGSIFVYDKSGVIFLEGPSSTRTVENNFGTIRDTIADRWYGSGVKIAGFGREITGANL